MKLSKIFLLIVSASLLSSCGCSHQTSDDTDEPYVPRNNPEEIFNGYYKDFGEWNNYQELKHKLYDLIRKDYRLNYYEKTRLVWDDHIDDKEVSGDTNWTTNRAADQSMYNHDKVYLLYNDNDEYKVEGTGTNWQREHCFPASLMTGYTTGDATDFLGTATDFHNLYASYSSGNSAHSNLCYGEVANFEGESRRTGNATYIPDVTFEPNDVDKGKVSRAIFYIATMFGDDNWVESTYEDNTDPKLINNIEYKDKINLVKGIYLTEKGNCTLHESARGNKCHSNLSTLIKWNNNILPDRHELQHCNFVQSQQNNRNPFIDFPGLVDYVWGDKRLEHGSLHNLPNIYDILDLDKPTIKNVGIKNVKYSYDGGDTFDSTKDLEIFGVKNNLETVDISGSYSISGITDKGVIKNSDNGAKISINYEGAESATYSINVANSAFRECDYVAMPRKAYFSDASRSVIRNQNLHLNNMDWVMTTTDPVTVDVVDENGLECGIKVGSSNKPAGTMVFTTSGSVDLDGKHVVKRAYIEANSVSSYDGGFNLNIKLADKPIYSSKIYAKTDVNFLSLGVDLSSMERNSGVVSFEFSNIKTGIKIGRIALEVDETSD